MRRNYCRSILLLWYPPSHSSWINISTLRGSTSGPAWYPSCPVISGKLPSSGLLHWLWFVSLCVGHLSAVFTPLRHFFYSTEGLFYFFATCPICPAKMSHSYRPTSVDTASIHIIKGITENVHKRLIHWRVTQVAYHCLIYVISAFPAHEVLHRPEHMVVVNIVLFGKGSNTFVNI